MNIIGTPLFQWEKGRQLQIIPLQNMTVSAVHFSNPGDIEALVVKPKEVDGKLVADIPNVLLQKGSNIVAYSVNVSSDCVETLRECIFPVRKRSKPADYVYTEVEILNYESLEKRIKAIEENGNDYILTDADKQEIAEMAAELVDVPGSGGNVDLTGYATMEWVKKQVPGGGSLSAKQIESCKEYARCVCEATGKTEAFLFFTDPHYSGRSSHNSHIARADLLQIADVYYNTPVSMCVSGGDWLNDGNTKENACWQLGVYDGLMKSLFDRYVMIVGNHDTNYQGKEYMESGADGVYDREAHAQCILSADALRSVWNRTNYASYFVVNGDCTRFYVFDTGLDWYPDMDEYKWEQVDWFANDLLSEKPERCAALLHIAGYSATNPTPLISNITQIANAYNRKASVTLNGKTYNFSSADGKFYFIIGGHTHEDLTYVLNDIVIITTTNLRTVSTELTFDLVLADYDAEKIYMVRVGFGSSRTLSLDNSSEEGGSDASNLFSYGVRTDYLRSDGSTITDSNAPNFSVNASEGYVRGKDASGNSAVNYKKDKYASDGSEFTLSGRFENETAGNTATSRFHCKMYNSTGELYTGSVDGWTYNNYFKSHYADTNNITFTLPAEVAEFQIGFLFNSVENDTDFIRIYDISLTKQTD